MKPVLYGLLAMFAASAQADKPVAPAPAAATSAAAPVVEFVGFDTPQTFGAEALAQLPRKRVDASDHGVSSYWEGVELRELLQRAGAPLGKALRGANLTRCVLVGAADGYRVIFALAEFDTEFGNNQALLADHREGKALDAKEGPFRLVLPREQRAGRWVRQVTRVELRDCAPR